jgi:endonuclease-8
MEGPGVRTIVDRLAPLMGKKVVTVTGKSRFPLERIIGGSVARIYPVGKLLFLKIPPCTLRVHFLMWGRYRLNGEIPGKVPKLTITFHDGSVLRFYASAIALLDSGEVERLSDPSLDPMDDAWDHERAIRLVGEKGNEWICDSLMDQETLPGVGNLIKNEALFAARVHPASHSSSIPVGILRDLLTEVRGISCTWYHCDQEGKRIEPLLKVYRKRSCPECGGKVQSGRIGSLQRISFWCPACQVEYRC